MMWRRLAIADFCQTGSGGTPSRNSKADYYDGGHIPWVKSGELLDEPLVSTEEFITDKGLRESSAKIVPPGAVLIAMYGATVGRTALLEIEATTNQVVCFLIPDKRLALSHYVWYALRASYPELLAKRVGGAQPNISQQIIKATQLSLPPLSEQSRIVELLDEADRLRHLRREADVKAARILPALFLKMFGDPATNPMEWPEKTVGALLKATDYGTSKKASDDGKGVPLIRMGNVAYDGTLQLDDLKYVELAETEAAKYRLRQGDILFNRTNSKELVGMTGLWDVDLDAVLASYFIRLRVDRETVEPIFLWAFMNSSHMKRVLQATARGAIGQANINTSELKALATYKPPIHIQRHFAAKVHAIRLALPKKRERSNIDNLFALLMQRAFSGQLTAKWREAHMKELLAEMEQQARLLNLPSEKEFLRFPRNLVFQG
jgi:type I restriction enzyme, S subunit